MTLTEKQHTLVWARYGKDHTTCPKNTSHLVIDSLFLGYVAVCIFKSGSLTEVERIHFQLIHERVKQRTNSIQAQILC